jgi:hypothetical protein
VTVKVLKPRRHLSEGDFLGDESEATEAPLPVDGLGVPARSWARHHLPAFSTDHFPSEESKLAQTSCCSKSAAFSDDEPQSFSKSKLCATSLNQGRREAGEFWQGGFFDHALRKVKEYLETVEYIPRNPVRRGLVQRAEEWKGSSVRE